MYRGYQRQVIRQPTQRDHEARLILLLLMRIGSKNLAQNFQMIKTEGNHRKKVMGNIIKISEHTAFICKVNAWHKLKQNVRSSKAEQRLFKDVMNLSIRIKSNVMRIAFQRIQRRVYESNLSALQKIEKSKKPIMLQAFKTLVINRKKLGWLKIQSFAAHKKHTKRIMVIAMIMKSAQKKLLMAAWSKILLQSGRSVSMFANQTQAEDLTLQVQDLKVQVENKNMNISRLQEEIEQYRQNSYRQEPNSYYFTTTNLNRSNRSSRKKLNSSVDKDSNDGSIKDLSFGSLFGGSYVTYKSRGSVKKGNCDCEYSMKYDKYKAAAQSYKNQLQIIKAELQFTKQMYDHMENQMKMQMSGDDKDRKIDRLQAEIKQIQKDREAMREKVAKYEKYVGKLKSQFKMKIQEIYRKVRKGN